MTDGERSLYRELQERLRVLNCQTQMLLSDCMDADSRVIANEHAVRLNILSGVHELCRWCGFSDAVIGHGKSRFHWRRFTHDKHPAVVLPVRTVTTDSKDPDVASWREAFWDGHWIELSRMIDYGWEEVGPGTAIPDPG